eukprot:g19612.t1
MTLKVDASGNILHLPSSFTIRGSRGYVTDLGQPRVCQTCGRSGHMAAHCKVTLCRNCKQEGHLTKGCKEFKSCNLMGKQATCTRPAQDRGAPHTLKMPEVATRAVDPQRT